MIGNIILALVVTFGFTCTVTVSQNISTAQPGGACKDTLATCSLLGNYYCTGSFKSWATQNCQKTCNLCGQTVVTTTPGPEALLLPRWSLFMKGVAGAPGPDLYQLWHSPQTLNSQVPAAARLTAEYNGHYKPDYSNHWKDFCIDMVKVSIYNKGVEKANIIFNATGADKNSWFTSDRIISSTWTDIKSASKDVMSMAGSATLGREFYISGHTSGNDQCDSTGWMMISTKGGCHFEAVEKKPTFYYAPGTSQAHWGFTTPLTGDVFAIQVHLTCLQIDSKPHATTAPVCHYKGKTYTDGQFWQDGCQYNCTCEDGSIGFYRCRDLCPTYTHLPDSCYLITKPGECCPKPHCVVPDPHPTTSQSLCHYKGKTYTEGQFWQDGCQYNCTCEDGSSGYYRCRDLCPTYTHLPDICYLITKPGECCPKPHCVIPDTHPNTSQPSVCNYKGVNYIQGQTWDEGCDMTCTCFDAYVGLYSCHKHCLGWSALPSTCHLDDAPPGLCCKQPKCPSGIKITIPKGYEKKYPGYTYQAALIG